MEPDSDTGLDMMTELSEDDDDGGRWAEIECVLRLVEYLI
jgi:hypothetical protein